MSSTRNQQLITIGVTALVTFILSAFLFSVTDFNLFGTAGDATTDGSILDEAGQPLRRTLVQTYAADGSIYMDVTDREGKFELEKLANGNYIIVASTVDQQYAYIGEWNIEEDGEDYQFSVVPTGSLTGAAAGCDNTCTITVSYRGIALVVQNLQADGSFAISGLAPALYEVKVFKGNSTTTLEDVEITSGGQAEVELQV